VQNIPNQVSELGRIRIGDKDEKRGFPRKLDHFRLTSSNRALLQAASVLYGGEVREWKGAPNKGFYELYTTTTAIDVLVPTASGVSVSFEIWSAGGCQRRCNGQFVIGGKEHLGEECLCPEDHETREALAKDGKACARILRLNVLLPDLPGLGVWRLESKGYHATAEIMGTLSLLGYAGKQHQIIEASLRLEQRSSKSDDGKTQRYVVPTLTPRLDTRQLLLPTHPPVSRPALMAPQPRLKQLSSELFGAPTSEPAPELVAKIDALLVQLGQSPEGCVRWWEALRRNYPDLTPAILTLTLEALEVKLATSAFPEPATEEPVA